MPDILSRIFGQAGFRYRGMECRYKLADVIVCTVAWWDDEAGNDNGKIRRV